MCAMPRGCRVCTLANGRRLAIRRTLHLRCIAPVRAGNVSSGKKLQSENVPLPQHNGLLAALPAAERERIYPQLEYVELPVGHVICEPAQAMRHAYFPTTALVSLLYMLENGASAEIAIVGNDGMVGVSLFMGGDSTPTSSVVQSAGHCFRLRAQTLKEEFARSDALRQRLLMYTQAMIAQMAQTAVCYRHHCVGQQLSRWLLLSFDRLQSNELRMTQERLASMLGVRREGVTEAAGKLQAAGVIQYSRGRIRVLDRPGLEQATCECYGVVKGEFARLLPGHGAGEALPG